MQSRLKVNSLAHIVCSKASYTCTCLLAGDNSFSGFFSGLPVQKISLVLYSGYTSSTCVVKVGVMVKLPDAQQEAR